MSCDHPSFVAEVNVQRLTNEDGDMVIAYAAELQIACTACGERFTAIGVPGGMLHEQPSTLADGKINIPLQPMSAWEPPSSFLYNVHPMSKAKLSG